MRIIGLRGGNDPAEERTRAMVEQQVRHMTRLIDDLLDVNLSLPFQSEVNTGFGVLAKVYLDALTHINGRQRVRDPNAEGVREMKQMALDI